MWPAGRLTKAGELRLSTYPSPGKSARGTVRADPTSMDSGSLSDLLHAYTDTIGIARVEGRAWYGLRRIMADMAEEVEKDTSVLREITNWKDEATRRRYLKKRNPKKRMKAAVTRGKIRQLLIDGGHAGDGVGRDRSSMLDLSELSTADLVAMAEAIRKRLERGPDTTRSEG